MRVKTGSIAVALKKGEFMKLPFFEKETRIMFGAHWTLHRQADLDATLLLFDVKGR